MQDEAKMPMLKITVIIKKSGLEVSFPNPARTPITCSPSQGQKSLENLDEAGKKIDLKPPPGKKICATTN